MRTIERATRAITATPLRELVLAAAMLTILAASPEFLLEIAVAVFCIDHLSRRVTRARAFRPALAQARSLQRKRGGIRE